jgi:acetylornithine aminotransferase
VFTGGLPIGAVLVKQRVADAMAPGDHGSTFAGNPLVTAAGETVLDVITAPGFLEGVRARGERLRARLGDALHDNAHVKEIRGMGLITGIQLDQVGRVAGSQAPVPCACMHTCI